MGLLTYLPVLMTLLAGREIPAGTTLEIRLTTAVGTYASKPGSRVSAVLTAPVTVGGEVLLPAGSALSGEVKSIRRVGLGIVHETAAMTLDFTRVVLADGTSFPLSARVLEVDNAREQVDRRNGRIVAARSTGSLSYRAGGYITMAVGFNLHAQLGLWAVKTLISEVPEAEIYYPAGVELTLGLRETMMVTAPDEREDHTPLLTEEEQISFDQLVQQLPERTTNSAHKASDPVNILFVGTRQQLSAAFRAAGWSETQRSTLKSHVKNIRAVIESQGNRAAPMSTLLLDGETPDMMWQKGLNDVGKRHHIRIWKRPETWNGEEIWVGAATHDVAYAFLRPGMPVTHRVGSMIDRERDKVAQDLEFASSVDRAALMERPEVSREMHNATGDRLETDGRLAILHLRDLSALGIKASFPAAPLAMHGRTMQRLARREILSLRNDLLRNNSYWRGYEAIRWAVSSAHHQQDTRTVADEGHRKLERLNGFVALR